MSRDDGGLVVIEWLVGITVMVLPAAVIALSFAGWSSRVNLAHTVAQEAGRAAVLSQTQETAHATGLEMADTLLRAAGVQRRSACGADDCAVVEIGGPLERGATVTVRVAMAMPAMVSHQERVDDYRSVP
jgi:hypothetical protein